MALPPVWQIGTGNDARPYADWFFEHHVAAVGPGSGGRWPGDDYVYDPSVLAFARDATLGHLVIAKYGRRRALGVGVLGSYNFDPTIDVEGWDLCHLRRTRWLDVEPRWFDRLLFPISRFCRCTDPDALAWVTEQTAGQHLSAPAEADLPPLPDPGPELDLSTLEPALAKALTRGRDWAYNTWEGRFGPWPSEAEMLCHVTVPILQALGWPPELIAVYLLWDVALFRSCRGLRRTARSSSKAKGSGSGSPTHTRR